MAQKLNRPEDIRGMVCESTFAHTAIGLIVGIVTAELVSSYAPTVLTVIVAALAIGAYCLWVAGDVKKPQKTVSLLILTTVFSVIGFLRLATYHKGISVQWVEAAQTISAKAEGTVRETEKTLQTDLRLTDGLKLRATLMRHGDEKPRPGDIVIIHGNISAPHNSGNPEETDYASFLLKHGYSGTVFCYGNCWKLTGRENANLRDRLLRLRDRLTDHYRNYFSGSKLAVLAALTLGDKTMLRAETRDIFSDTGTSHILALSGLHLGILFCIYNFLLKYILIHTGRTRRRWEIGGFVFGLLFVWFFTLLAGMPLSLVRAALMCSLAQSAILMRRDVFSLNNLAFAATVILLLSPESLFDVGFELSFLAVLGILMFMPLFPTFRNGGRNRIERILAWCAIAAWNIFCVSVAASVFTMPLVAYTFHTVPIWGWAASIVAIPITAALLFLSLSFLVFSFIEGLFAIAIGWCLDLLFKCLEAFANLPYASFDLYPTLLATFLFYILIFIAVSYIRKHNVWKIVAMVATLVCIVTAEVVDARNHKLRPQIVFYNSPTAPALHFIETKESSQLWTTMPERADTALSYIRHSFWKRYRMSEPTKLRNDTVTATLAFTPHAVSFRGCRIGLAYERMKAEGRKALRVKYLFIVKGWNRPIAEALNAFSPDSIILDAGLSDFYRRKFRAEADSLNIPYCDIRESGAWIVANLE